jgi:AraC-like DNA-binding protein
METGMDHFSPYIRVAFDHMTEAPWVIPERVIWDYELMYVMEGRVVVTVEDKLYNGISGDVFLFKPLQKHSICSADTNRIRQPHVHFDLYSLPDREDVTVSHRTFQQMNEQERHAFRKDELSLPPYSLPNHFRLSQRGDFERLLLELIREQEAKPPFYKLRTKSFLLDMIALLMREQFWASKIKVIEQVEQLMEVRDYLELHANRNVNLEELAIRFHLSKFHLIQLFKKLFQVTPIQYHQKIRIQRAKSMIQCTSASLGFIAHSLGFANIQSFSRAFKTVDGSCPSEYRNT